MAALRSTTGKKGPPAVVLCSRGFSFEKRLEFVAKYAQHNKVKRVVLLHCPEKKYSKGFVTQVTERAEELFEELNKYFRRRDDRELDFELLCKEGLLQDNLRELIEERDVRVVFVGMKMLDYRLNEIKKLDAPFYFIGS